MFYEIINNIKMGYHHNFKYIKIKFNKNDKVIINFFLKLGIIKKIFVKDGNYYVEYNYYRGKKSILFKNFYKPSRKVYIKLNMLRKLTLKKNLFFLISTNKGIMTNVKATKLGVGGLIILKIWN